MNYLISQSYSLIVSFLGYLVFVLWMHYFILFLRGHLLFFKRQSFALYIVSVSSQFLFSFPFLFDVVFLGEGFSQLSGDSLLSIHI